MSASLRPLLRSLSMHRTTNLEHQRRLGLWFGLAILTGLAGGMAGLVATGRFVSPDVSLPASAVSVTGALPLLLVLYGVGIVVARMRSAPGQAVPLFTAGFLLRVMVGIALAYLVQVDDEIGLYMWAAEDAGEWGRGNFVANRGGYVTMVTALFYVFGPNLLIAKYMNAFLGSMVAFVIYDLALEMGGSRRTARRAFVIGMFLPPLVYWSSLNMKEIGTAFLFTLMLWALVRGQKLKLSNLLRALALVAAIGWFREPAWAGIGLLAVMSVSGIGVVKSESRRGDRWWIGRRIVVVVVIVALAGGVVLPLAQELRESVVLERISDESYQARALPEGARVADVLEGQGGVSLWNSAVLGVRGVLAPSPLRVLYGFSLQAVIESIIAIVWYVLVPLAVVGVWFGRARAGVVGVGAWVVVTIGLVSMALPVGGILARHRVSVIPAMVGLAALRLGGGVGVTKFERLWVVVVSVFSMAFLVWRVVG